MDKISNYTNVIGHIIKNNTESITYLFAFFDHVWYEHNSNDKFVHFLFDLSIIILFIKNIDKVIENILIFTFKLFNSIIMN